MSQSSMIEVSAASRFATSILASFSYLTGLSFFLIAWLGSYSELSSGSLVQNMNLPQGTLSDMVVFSLCFAGLCILAFARKQASLAGPTPAHLLTILICGVLGFGVWGLALFSPASLFPSPLSSSMNFAAFVIGWFGIAGLSNAAWTMAGRTKDEGD